MRRSLPVRRAPAAALALALAAAASAALAATACASGETRRSSEDRNVITAEDMATIPQFTALDAVRRLKPHWLRQRGMDSFRGSSPVAVIVDGVVQGGVRLLGSYYCGDLEEIRYLDRRQATMRYGDQARGGAIVLVTANR